MKDLKQVLKTRPVFGTTLTSMSSVMADVIGAYGLDYLFIDAEHTPCEVTSLREVVLASENAGIAPLIRTTRPDEIEVRKALEIGAAGVICPHCKTRKDVETMIAGAKFPPLGHRGYDCGVHAAKYGGYGYDPVTYMNHCHEKQLVIPMCEDFEFIDNIDDILEVDGIDAVCFGPADYAMSLNITKLYKIDHPEVRRGLDILLEKTAKKGIEVMLVANPPTYEAIDNLLNMGVRMVTLASEIIILQQSLKEIKEKVLDRYS